MADIETKDESRTIQEVSSDIQQAGIEEAPSVPEPKAKTPEEMTQNPEELLKDECIKKYGAEEAVEP